MVREEPRQALLPTPADGVLISLGRSGIPPWFAEVAPMPSQLHHALFPPCPSSRFLFFGLA